MSQPKFDIGEPVIVNIDRLPPFGPTEILDRELIEKDEFVRTMDGYLAQYVNGDAWFYQVYSPEDGTECWAREDRLRRPPDTGEDFHTLMEKLKNAPSKLDAPQPTERQGAE